MCCLATGQMTSQNRHGTKTTPFLVHSAVSLTLHSGAAHSGADHSVAPVSADSNEARQGRCALTSAGVKETADFIVPVTNTVRVRTQRSSFSVAI